MNAVATSRHHLGCIIQANNPKGDCDLRARANQSLRSHFSVEHAITVGWTVAATALRQMGNVLPSYPFQSAPLFHLLITNHLVSLGCGYAALFTSVSECIYRFCQQAKESMVFFRRFRGVLRSLIVPWFG